MTEIHFALLALIAVSVVLLWEVALCFRRIKELEECKFPRLEGFTLRAENALRSTIKLCEEAEKEGKRQVLLARHWALVVGAPKEEALDTHNWVDGEIKRGRSSRVE